MENSKLRSVYSIVVADINARIFNDATPLCIVALERRDYVEFARMLLRCGANIEDHDDDLWTPLHRAVRAKNIQIVRLLLEHGADVNARDKSGKTPSELESAGRTPEIAELLSKYGAMSVE
jgi:ankyrin repeat protein